jgi:hypothetical protein
MNWKGLINAYRSFLPVTDQTPVFLVLLENIIAI